MNQWSSFKVPVGSLKELNLFINISNYIYIYIIVVPLFNGISDFLGYSMPKA